MFLFEFTSEMLSRKQLQDKKKSTSILQQRQRANSAHIATEAPVLATKEN
jgi:hypothetical protein